MSAQAPTKPTQTTTANQAPATTTVHLKLRPKKKAVMWTEDVVDNEGMGKRSSKICCVYEPPRNWDDSSSSSDSSSDDEHDEHDCGQPGHHHHHKKKDRKPVQHPFDDQPFTGDYTPKPTA